MNPYEETIEVLEKYGWIREQAGNTRIGFCVSGALIYVAHQQYCMQPGTAEGIVHRERDLLAWRHFFCNTTGIYSVADWNDRDGRTKEEVLEELRIVAKAWANKDN